MVLTDNPFWDEVDPGLPPLAQPGHRHEYRTRSTWEPVYQPAWYGDGENYWAPDFIGLFGAARPLRRPHRQHRRASGRCRWIQTAPAARRRRRPDRTGVSFGDGGQRTSRSSTSCSSIPTAPEPTDPRPTCRWSISPRASAASSPARAGRRTRPGSPTRSAGAPSTTSMPTATSSSSTGQGEWLTKERTGYGFNIGSSDYHNTLALENDPPDHYDPSDYRYDMHQRGSQWMIVAAGDPDDPRPRASATATSTPSATPPTSTTRRSNSRPTSCTPAARSSGSSPTTSSSTTGRRRRPRDASSASGSTSRPRRPSTGT